MLLRRAQKPEPLRCQQHAYSEDMKLEEPLLFTSFQNYWTLFLCCSKRLKCSDIYRCLPTTLVLNWPHAETHLKRLLFFLTGRFSPKLNSSQSPNTPGYCAAAGQWSPWQRFWAHRWTEPSSEATGTEQPTKQTRHFVRGYPARARGKRNKEAFWDGSEGRLVRCSPVLAVKAFIDLFLFISSVFSDSLLVCNVT